MKSSNIFNSFFATFLFLFTVITTNQAGTGLSANTSLDGGPRTIIQNMTEVTVLQPVEANLSIKIINSLGEEVMDIETEDANVTMSIENLSSGTYTIETVDSSEDYQEFTITID